VHGEPRAHRGDFHPPVYEGPSIYGRRLALLFEAFRQWIKVRTSLHDIDIQNVGRTGIWSVSVSGIAETLYGSWNPRTSLRSRSGMRPELCTGVPAATANESGNLRAPSAREAVAAWHVIRLTSFRQAAKQDRVATGKVVSSRP